MGRLCEKGATIPDAWFRFGELASLRGLAQRVADARTTFEDAHRGMHLADQKAWLKLVEDHNYRCTQSPVDTPAFASIPDADMDALDSLG